MRRARAAPEREEEEERKNMLSSEREKDLLGEIERMKGDLNKVGVTFDLYMMGNLNEIGMTFDHKIHRFRGSDNY